MVVVLCSCHGQAGSRSQLLNKFTSCCSPACDGLRRPELVIASVPFPLSGEHRSEKSKPSK
eukprot:6467705-Pyramimonas_sp.AAC.1